MTRRLLVVALLAVAALVAPAHAAGPATFRVGAAVMSIDPTVPVYAGGFGASPPIRRVAGALQVRALYVSNGRHAVAFAVADAQGWFASYQDGPALGIDDIRTTSAAAMSKAGVRMGPDDVVVQATHSHSAPTLEGIWGPTPPSYLKLVHDRTVAALVAAARAARPSHLQWATVDVPSLNNITTAQYDSFPGWTQDGQVSVLRAVAVGSGATVATFANVPAHPDIVCGACLSTLTADYFGAMRESLDAALGGVSVVSAATLGREETPVQASGIAQMRWYAGVVDSYVLSGLGRARWVTDPTVAAQGSTVQVPGVNPLLLGLIAANHAPDDVKAAAFDASGEYPINRADTPPYLTGPVIGSPLTALRIGPLAYVSMPGEPFPEVRLNMLPAIHGAAAVVALSKAQDDLGYFYPSWVYPFASAVYATDQGTYNVAPQAGDQIMQAQLANVAGLGFGTEPLAVPAPLPADYGQALRPGIQALAAPSESDASGAGTSAVVLQAIYAPASQAGAPLAGKVRWDFGDGTATTSGALSFGGPCTLPNVAGNGVSECARSGAAFVTHRFRPGRWKVTVSGADTSGNPVSWTLPVVVHPAPRLLVRQGALRESGGSGHLLAATWRLADGSSYRGLVLPRGVRWTSVVAVDSAGGLARA